MKHTFSKRFVSMFLCIALLMTCLPLSIMAAPNESSTSVADVKTLSDWETWFSPDSSRYAGGVFLDKSVYTATQAKTDDYFEDIRNSLSIGEDNFGNENFMVALSALGSNSEVLGYSHTPTDTMLVLDASTSMGTGDKNTSSLDDMVEGANEAITRLLALNNYNRVGVVIYNGTASVLLPLDRYIAGNAKGEFIEYARIGNVNHIRIAPNVTDVNGNDVDTDTDDVAQAQGTYTQGGIYAAAKQFTQADTVIEDGKIQGGTKRLPILVLMTDGEPSYRTKTGRNNTINNYHLATNENVANDDFREDDITAFSTMLTAAWAEAAISEHYGTDTRFYTLGYALSANHEYAQNVLDPMNPNNSLAKRFAGYAAQYLAMQPETTATFKNENDQVVFQVTRASAKDDMVKSLDYVDRYWQAAQVSKLSAAFDEIVDEIIIQSRYYSTLVSNNDYTHDGFISFTDEIGTYMEVKDIKGMYIGDGKLISGGMFAEFAMTGTVKDYDKSYYSEDKLDGFENEILSAVSQRFSISLSEANLLLNTAKENGFISYTSPDEFSNYVAWYADEDNNYLAPYTNSAIQAQNSAKYIVRSYFYMGDVTQNYVETSMLYAMVRVREDIETGRQIVDMNVPAALLPLVTYTITVDGDVLNAENVTGITCEQKKPISLLFEVGLDSEITPINITEKVGEDFRKDANGVYTFYTNRWTDDNGEVFTLSNNPDPHIFNHGIMNTTVTQFIPSLENERFYYTENKQLLDSDYHVYTGEKPTADGTYYVEYKWVEGDADHATLKTAYDLVSPEILKDADNLIQIDGKQGWFIQKGTPQFYFGDEVHGEQGHSHKTENITDTLGFSNYPQIVYHDAEGHTGYHMLNYLGNNGRIEAAPAQGIKLSKTVSRAVSGAPDSFEFEIALSGTALANAYPVYIEHADGTSDSSTAAVTNGKVQMTLADGDVAYLYDLPTGTQYAVTEAYNSYYTGTSTNANGTVALHTLVAVDFVNSPKGYGSLLVEKDVTHPFDAISTELANKAFDITVKFEGDEYDLSQIKVPEDGGLVPTVENGAYTYSFTLKDGSDLLFTHIPEGIQYTVSERNIPTGFTLKTAQANLAGTIAKDTPSEALLVNDYQPAAVSPGITISGEKTLTGRDWDAQMDQYQVALQQVVFGGQGTVAVGEPTIVDIVKTDGADYTIDMSGIVYEKPGTYSYTVYEVSPDEADRVDNVSYDTSFAMFSLTVVDQGTGALVVDSVTVHQQTANLSGNAENGWTITKDFTNHYQVTTVRFSAVKRVVDEADNSVEIQNHRGGIMFALYDSTTADYPVHSTLTNENGDASFAFAVKQNEYQTERYYYLREVIPLVNSQVVGMTYDTAFKYVVAIEWAEEADAPTVRYYHYSADAPNGLGSEIVDIEATPLVITNTYDDSVVSTPTVDLGGKKTLNGGALRAQDSFTFELYETDAAFDTNGRTPLQTRTVDAQTANGAFTFDGVTFDSVGTKYLVVCERNGNAGGIGYDNTRYHITVDVAKTTNDDNKTVLTATLTSIHKVGNGDVPANALNFNNTYTINDEEAVTVTGHKSLLGRTLVEGEFTFGIYEADSDTPTYTVSNDKDGYFTFPTMHYTIAGERAYDKTYTYTVKEIIPDDVDQKGITYNSNGKQAYTLVVHLVDDGNGGTTKTVTLDGETVSDIHVEFENSYAATGTSLTLSGTKKFNKDSGEFDFDLYETGDDFAIATDAIPKTAKATVVNGSGEYAITLDYTNADRGYHYYVLREAVPAETNGVLYDATRYYITVNVMDNGHGEMETHVMRVISANTSDTATITTLDFTNKYVAAATEYVIQGKKTLQGNKAMQADLFEFRLSNEDGEITTVKNDGNGDFAFPAQIFEAAGDYVFYVEEINGGSTIDGITYDEATFTITIPVLDDGVGSLYVDEANIQFEKEADGQKADATALSFVNVYSASATDTIYLEGTKQIAENAKPLKDKEFTFELYEADETFAAGKRIESVENAADGSFKFETAICFEQAGTFYYTIVEKKGDADYITYDETVYAVTFTVEDDGAGKLHSTKEVFVLAQDGAVTAEKVAFVNQYTPADAQITLSGEKTLDGRKLNADEFKFFLYPADETYAVDEDADVKEAKNQADGSFAFDAVTIGEVGTYYFVIREDAETTAERVTNDNAVYHVAIEVKDDENGKLYEAGRVITKADSEDAVESIVFHNVFTPKPEDITVGIGVVKTVVNKGSEKIGPEDFEFVLENTETNEKVTATSDADGKASFTLDYTEADIGKTYTYKLTEIDGGKENVTYSTAAYTVTVTISLSENNELVASFTLNGEDATAVVAEFENIYEYTPTPSEPDDPTPSEPDDPTPSEPDDPTPSEPDDPTPSEPDDPTPSEPDDPTPSEPDDPTPSEPDDPTPSEPDDPTPSEPDDPTPSEPDEPTSSEPESDSDPTPSAPTTQPTHSNNPKTGDNTALHLWIALLFVSGGIVTLTVCNKKRKNKEN